MAHTVWVGQPADADSMISIEDYSDLPGTESIVKYWEFLARRKYADITLNNSLSISYSPRPLAAVTAL